MKSVVILVADGVRPDTLASAVARGDVPAMAALSRDGSLSTVTAAFPSVTGVGYAPFLLGRLPGPAGLPGLRWFDRCGSAWTPLGRSRSYVGIEMRYVDADLTPDAPTIFELVPDSLGSLSVIQRGLAASRRVARGAGFAARAAVTHFLGNLQGWLAIDRALATTVARRIREERPAFTFAAFTGADKVSHACGHDAPEVISALQVIDDCVAEVRRDAERAGRWENMHLWVVSDHGHSAVDGHDDLASWARALGIRTLAHPWVIRRAGRADLAVMPSGNAMAHLYVDLARKGRPWWGELEEQWGAFAGELIGRPSVDLLIVARSAGETEIRGAGRGVARIVRSGSRYSYRPVSGDPLGCGEVERASPEHALAATLGTDYPDAIVQIASLAGSARAGDIIVSARCGGDFRKRYEPIPHVSAHGGLHRDHMSVPLLTNRPTRSTPQRTVDVMPSALRALDVALPPMLDGYSFV